MLLIAALVLIAVWFVGLITATLLGGFIHLLLLFGVALVLISLFRGERLI